MLRIEWRSDRCVEVLFPAGDRERGEGGRERGGGGGYTESIDVEWNVSFVEK